MVKLPNSVLWQLTKKNNSFLVKFNGQTFSHDPLNLTGLHNASSSGLSNNNAVGVQATKVTSKKGKGKRAEFQLLQRHKTHNKIAKAKKNSTSGTVYSAQPVRRGVNRAAKVVKGLTHISERVRKLALKRVQKLHGGSRSHVKGAVAKKEEKK